MNIIFQILGIVCGIVGGVKSELNRVNLVNAQIGGCEFLQKSHLLCLKFAISYRVAS